MPVVIEGSKGVNGGAAEFKSFKFGIPSSRACMVGWTQTDHIIMMHCAYHILGSGLSLDCVTLSVPSSSPLSLDIRNSGLGGMIGSPVLNGGYIAVYHIYNPVAESQALVGINLDDLSTISARKEASTVYSGVDMPSGYTHSALVGIYLVRKTTKVLAAMVQRDRTINISPYPNEAISVGLYSGALIYPNASVEIPFTYTDGNPNSDNVVFVPPPFNAAQMDLISYAGYGVASKSYDARIQYQGNRPIGQKQMTHYVPSTSYAPSIVTSGASAGLSVTFLAGATVNIKHYFHMASYTI